MIKYETIKLKDLNASEKNGLMRVSVEDKNFHPTKRFWRSMALKYRFNDKFFNLFSPEEVFQKIKESNDENAPIRIAFEENANSKRILGISNPLDRIFEYNELVNFLKEQGALDIKYNDGIVSAMFTPQGGDQDFQIGLDKFQQRFELRTAVDGIGQSKINLSLLRLVCLNGMTALSPVFSSPLNIGKEDPYHSLNRALENYSNDDGFGLLENKMSDAQDALASVHECNQVQRILLKTESGSKNLTKFHRMTGSLSQMYGLNNMNALSAKKLKLLPSKCTVYDILNFITELATHQAKSGEREMLLGLTGKILAQDYDLEGTYKENTEFQELFLETK